VCGLQHGGGARLLAARVDELRGIQHGTTIVTLVAFGVL
jgi:hypothetical protein